MGGDEGKSSKRDRQSNENIANWNIASNEKIAEQNLAYQQAKLDWDKQVQQNEWSREDTTYQRTVADARAAGLSPLALQGLDGSGEVVPTEAPQNGMHYDKQGLNNRHQSEMDRLAAVNQLIGLTSNLVQQGQDLYSQQLQNNQQQLTNQYLANTLAGRSRMTNNDALMSDYDADMSYLDAEDRHRRAQWNKMFGWHDGMSTFDKSLAILNNAHGEERLQRGMNYSHNGDGKEEYRYYSVPNFSNPASMRAQYFGSQVVDKLIDYAGDILHGKTELDKQSYYKDSPSRRRGSSSWQGFN